MAFFKTVVALVSMVLVLIAKPLQAIELLFRKVAKRVCPMVAESGPANPSRNGPQQFHMGIAVQYSSASAPGWSLRRAERFTCADALDAVRGFAPGIWNGEWQMRPLPEREGVLVAVRGSGLFLVNKNNKGQPVVVWQKRGPWAGLEVVAVSTRKGIVWELLLFWQSSDMFGHAGSGDTPTAATSERQSDVLQLHS